MRLLAMVNTSAKTCLLYTSPATGEEVAEEEIEEEPIKLRGETKICPVCKAEVDGDALFCNHCGAQL